LPKKGKYLGSEDLTQVGTHQNIPNAILQLHSKNLKIAKEKGWVNDYQEVQIDSTLSRLCDAMGMCERINNTVFPTTYNLFVLLFLYLFVAILPFGIIDFFGYAEAPIIILIAMPFFLLERTAVHMQDPFKNIPTDTPVTAIAQTIEMNLYQMMEEHFEAPDFQLEDKYYLM